MELLHSGKVRDVYADGDDVVLVARDTVSVNDVVFPTPIPDKGKLLTALSLWWFDQLQDVVGNHVISDAAVPEVFAGRAIRCRRLQMVKVECVARGYLAGSGLRDYRATGAVCGVALPPGLQEGSRLPEPIFTPTSKADVGHDQPMSFRQVEAETGAQTAARLRDITVEVYRRGAAIAAERGVVVADAKLEFGWSADGELVLGDEVLTSDCARFWPAESWQPGRPQQSFDKQYLRDWAAGSGWDGGSAPPQIPEAVVAATRARYVEAYERLTARRWTG